MVVRQPLKVDRVEVGWKERDCYHDVNVRRWDYMEGMVLNEC